VDAGLHDAASNGPGVAEVAVLHSLDGDRDAGFRLGVSELLESLFELLGATDLHVDNVSLG